MKETDDHFSAAQIAGLDRLGIPFATVAWERVRLAYALPATMAPQDEVPIMPSHVERAPKCPILDEDDLHMLVILPDGEERWVQK